MSTSALAHDVKAAPPARSGLKPLPINRPGDVYEQEAERVSRDVIGGNGTRPAAWSLSKIGIAAQLQRECSCGGSCDDCKKMKKPEQILQRDAAGDASPMTAPPLVHDVLRGAGNPLDRSTRSFMESRFGYNFTSVRVYHDDAAAQSARSVAANAYTVGDKIVFNQDRYAPDSHSGRQLLAHELAHVVQQSRGGAAPATAGDASLEADAQYSAHKIEHGNDPLTVHKASGIGLARDVAPTEGLIKVNFPDGVKQLTQEQFAQYKATAIRRLRNTLQGVASAADYGRKIQTDTLAEYQGGVESLWDVIKKPKSLIGIASDIKAGVTPPYIGMWSNPKSAIERGLAACDRGDLALAARQLELADSVYKEDMATWNAYLRATIGGAEGVVQNLETVRDVSFAIALAAGAAVAAPVIAGAVATTGATGAVATGLTATGTAVVTGTGGAVLRGGSTAAGSLLTNGKVNTRAAWADTKKGFKEGAVTGFTAGLGTGLQAAGKGAQLARPLVQGAARRCLTEAGVNVAGEVTTELLDAVIPGEGQKTEQAQDGPKPVVNPKVRAALTGCLSGALGVPVAKLGRSGGKVADVAVNTGVGFVDAKLQGQSNKDAALAGVQNAATSFLVSKGHHGSEEAKARKSATKQEATPLHPATATHAPDAAASGTGHPHSPEAVAPTPTEKARKKVTQQLKEKQKIPAGNETTPAINKEEAKAKAPIGDGHEAVVTEHGIGKCSPGPCPVIELIYAKELEANPKLKKINESIQTQRTTDPDGAAKKAAALIRTLDAIRGNAKPAAGEPHGPSGPDRGTTRDQWKQSEHDRRQNLRDGREFDAAFDKALDAGTLVPRVKGGRIDDHKVPTKVKSRLDVDAIDSEVADKGDKPIPLKTGETGRDAAARVKTVIGKSIGQFAELKPLWEAAAKQALGGDQLTQANYREKYKAARGNFWNLVNRNTPEGKAARAIFENAGFGIQEGRNAPMLANADGMLRNAESRISLDHKEEKGIGDGWKKALDADNLQLEFEMANKERENSQQRNPELRPPVPAPVSQPPVTP